MIENNPLELDMMKQAMEEIDPSIHCISLRFAEEVIPAVTNELKHFPDYIFVDVEMSRKNITDLLATLCPMKALNSGKIVVFGPVMPKRVAYAYRVMGANYAFQKPATQSGYREIFSRILGKERSTIHWTS